MRERKKIEKGHLAFLADYIGKKIITIEDFSSLLAEPGKAEQKAKEFKKVMAAGDLDHINDWFNSALTPQAWRKMWLASAGRANRQANPRSEHTIHKELAEQIKVWAGSDDINEAARMLLAAVKKGR